MNSFYLFGYQYEEGEDVQTKKRVSATVIFCSGETIDESDLQTEIKTYYEENYQTDYIFIIGSGNIKGRLTEVFVDLKDQTFKGIPKRQETALYDSINVFTFSKDGELGRLYGSSRTKEFLQTYLNEGLTQIFVSRGGLIVSEGVHHYVFPSGKHCDRFLRTGNILLYSPEIFFIAFALLRHFDDRKFTRIYTDTSSINSIAFALFDLKNRFLHPQYNVSIESFNSYEGLYKNSQQYTKDSFILVSASTSTNIIKYILNKQTVIERDNIIVLYYLAGGESDYANVKDQVLCNLTKSDINKNGIDAYPSYYPPKCEFCNGGSYAVSVTGDVFLLESPKINKILLTKTDRDVNLSKFVRQFKSVDKGQTVLKAHFKDRTQDKYEVYIDFVQIIRHVKSTIHCADFKSKIEHYIQQYIPANTLYLLHLQDEGSKEMAQYILDKISSSYNEAMLPRLIPLNGFEEKLDKHRHGTIVVVGSCISNGKNLLYISRALRPFENLRIVYFVGIVRTSGMGYTTTLTSNLKMGRYGGDSNSFVSVETMYCNNKAKLTPWIVELDFLRNIIKFIKDNKTSYEVALTFFEKRKNDLNQASGDTARGLAEGLFYPNIITEPFSPLELQKGFAFWDFGNYMNEVVQSDTFFTISNILNSLRNSNKTDRQLKQAVYVRNLLDPANFNRFNDGIIQASLLRSARADELSYDMDYGISQEMFDILETVIKYHEQQQGEALLEFLYAVAIKKLSLDKAHLVDLLALINDKCKHELFLCFAAFIRFKLIDEPEALRNTPLPPLKLISSIPIDELPDDVFSRHERNI